MHNLFLMTNMSTYNMFVIYYAALPVCLISMRLGMLKVLKATTRILKRKRRKDGACGKKKLKGREAEI